MKLKHKLAAILFCDIVGYTATTQTDESEAARQIEVHRRILESSATRFNGEILQYYGDGSLTIFPSVIDAVDAALDLQDKLNEENVPLRAGIHLGEIYFKDDQFIGDGINVASRIQSEAVPGQVLVSQTVSDLLKNQSHLQVNTVGERRLKNVTGSMTLYSVVKTESNAPERPKINQPVINTGVTRLTIWIALTIAVSAIAFFGISKITVSRVEVPEVVRLAVLPFRSLSDDAEDKYLCLGISDDIRSGLAAIKGLEVRSRSSSEMVHELNLSASEIGTRLNIDYLLEGSLRRSDDQLQVNLALVDVKSDMTVVPIEFSASSSSELLAIDGNVSSRVLNAIRPQGNNEQSRGTELQTDNYNAYRNYLLGRSYLLRTLTQKDLIKSEEHFNKAIEEDPDFGRAYAGLAEVKLMPAAWGYANMDDGIKAARPLAERAFQLAPNDAETQYILGTLKEFERDFEEAEKYFHKAIELDPSNALAYLRLSRVFIVRGEWDAAIDYAWRATKLDPLSPLIASLKPIALIRSEKYVEAETACRNALVEFQGDNNLKFHLAEALTMQGKYDEAVSTLLSRTVPTADVNFLLGYTYAKMGNEKGAQKVLDYLVDKESKSYVPPAMIGAIYFALGDTDLAHDWLSRETNYFMLMFPLLKPLWQDEKFRDIFAFIDQQDA